MEQQPRRLGSQWPWVAVAAIVAIAGVAIAFIVVNGNSGKSTQAVTGAPSASKSTGTTTAHKTSKPKVVVKTVTTQTKTVVQQPAAPAQPSGSASGLAACDQNISVNSATSCPFAANVFYQYAQDVQSGGGPGTYTVYVYSPATGQNYNDTCSYNPANQIVSCSHGSDLIQFPYYAAEVYHP